MTFTKWQLFSLTVSLALAANVWAAPRPSAPSNLSATAVSSSEIDLTWHDNSSNELGFRIQRAPTSTGPWTQVGSVSAGITTYADTGLTASTLYYYRVCAYNSKGNSGFSNVASATTLTSSGTKPCNYTLSSTSASFGSTGGTGSVMVTSGTGCSWTASSGVSWVTITAGSSGSGNGTVNYSVAPNGSASSRTGSLTIAGQTFTVTQAADTTAPTVTITSPTSASTWSTSSSTMSLGGTASDNVGVTAVTWANSAGGSGTASGTTSWSVSSVTLTTGTNTITVTAKDAAGNAGRSTLTVTYTPLDTTPPSLTVSQPTNGQVFTVGSITVSGTASDASGIQKVTVNGALATGTTSWTASLSLSSGANTIVVVATDNSSNHNSTTQTVSVTYNPPDTTPPSVSLSSPTNGSTVSATITVAAAASDNVGVAKVELYRDSSVLLATDTLSPYTTTFDTTSLPNGLHTFFAIAYDAANNTATSATATVTFNNPPPPAPSNLSATAVSSSQVNLAWQDNSSNETGFKLERSLSSTFSTVTTITLGANVTSYSDVGLAASTLYYYRVKAYSLNWGDSPYSNTAIVSTPAPADTTSPTTSLTSPTNGASVSGTVTLTANASDNVGVTKVEFYADVLVGTVTAAPYTLNWNSASESNGSHSFYTKAYDAAGNVGTSSTNTVTISNSTALSNWAMDIGGTGTDMGYSTATDTNGNIFVAGYFSGSVNFGGGVLTSAGGQDIFVAKYSPSGGYLWAQRFGGSSDDAALSIAVDPHSGDVAVTGYFNGVISFGTNSYTSAGAKDIFLAKLSGGSGAVQWSRQISGHSSTFADDYGYGVAVDPSNGDVVIVGAVAAYTDFGGGLVFTSSSTLSSFVARYTSAGVYRWAKLPSSVSNSYGQSVAIDGAGNVIVAGFDVGTINWGGGNLPFVGSGDNSYVVKFNSAGTYVWSKGWGSTQLGVRVDAYGVAVDANGNVGVTGWGEGAVDFGSGVQINLSGGFYDGYLVKLSGVDGTASWGKSFVVSGSTLTGAFCRGLSVAFNAAGNVVLAGQFQGSCDFGAGTFSSANAGVDGFVTEYSGTGSHVQSLQLGGTGWDTAYGTAVDRSGNILVTGASSGGNFNGSTLTSNGGYDIFLLKTGP